MATLAQNLQTRIDAIGVQLAAMSSTKAGGKPSYQGDGRSVDHVGYKRGLLDELKELQGLLVAAAPFDIQTNILT